MKFLGRKNLSSDEDNRLSLNMYRLILFLAGVLYPVFSIPIQMRLPGVVDPLWVRFLLSLIFLGMFFLTIFSKKGADNVLVMIWSVGLLANLHFVFLMLINSFQYDFFLPIFSSTLIISLVLSKPFHIFVYHVVVFFAVMFAIFDLQMDMNFKFFILSHLFFFQLLSLLFVILKRRADKAISASKTKFNILFNKTHETIILNQFDEKGVFGDFIEVNDIACEMIGYTRDEFKKLKANDFFVLFSEENKKEMLFLKNELSNTKKSVFETEIKTKFGSTFPAEVHSQVIDFEGNHTILSILRDITRRKAAEEKTKYYAYHDSLTGLPNRNLLFERLRLEIDHAERDNSIIALLFVDLIRFKHINDTFGHETGDIVLREVSSRLKKALRKSDTTSRFGSDEFIVIAPDLKSKEDVVNVTEKIFKTLSEPVVVGKQEFFISASIGISFYPNDSLDPHELIKNSDIAMFKAKEEKKSAFKVFDKSMQTLAVERVLIENSLKRAIREDEFRVFYQPIIDLFTGKISGMEALIRWQHPELGLIAPDRFIAIAEDIGVIEEVDQWIFKTVCKKISHWNEVYSNKLRVAVNFSAVNFKNPALLETLQKFLNTWNLSPESIDVEITESFFLGVDGKMISMVHGLKEAGIKISIDDFGMGYSSLSYLKHFHFDNLKIDRSFVNAITDTCDKNYSIVKAIVEMARHLKVNIIAEGIETKSQLQALINLRCPEGQGYYFSKPLPEEKIEELLLNEANGKTNFHI